ncbi:hypothetical protein F5144DRAFT_9059 [Chaetomium tenue]|uniref:Uncharacterized protein n=1 Tax=Chaetomium tenue TaxID=1854479 RepID=A0ACB7PMW9_9PEZI|nr:hypothetical protein F5144DRAFT_9059 [Chaetomium globosum]
MEGWMQKSERYGSITKEMMSQDYNTASVTLSREVRDPQDLQEFYDWVGVGSGLTYHLEALTPEEYVRHVDSMSFHSMKARDKLKSASHLIVPIGFDGPFIYRLLISLADEQTHIWGDVEAERARLSESLMGPCFLGVYLTVNPREPSYSEPGNLSETSRRSVESADADAPGFPFFHLGELEYGERRNGRQGPWGDGHEEKLSKKGAKRSGGWRETGYGLVARLNPSGYADGIYIMMHNIDGEIPLMYPSDSEGYYTEDADKEPRIITHSSRCLPLTSSYDHGGEGRFWFAKFAPNLSSCGKDYQIVLTEKTEHPVELVRGKRSEDGRIVRNISDKKNWPPAAKKKSSAEESSAEESSAEESSAEESSAEESEE